MNSPPASPSAIDAAIARVLAGDRESYRVLVEAAGPAVRAVAAAILPEPHAVDDVVQESFILAFARLREYRPGSDAIAWLKACARNLALNERRRWLREQRRRDGQRAALAASLDGALTDTATGVRDDLDEALRRCLGRLGGSARAVVEAFYWRGAAPAAIAGEHGRDAGWVRVVLHRSRAALAECLRGEDAP